MRDEALLFGLATAPDATDAVLSDVIRPSSKLPVRARPSPAQTLGYFFKILKGQGAAAPGRCWRFAAESPHACPP